MENRNFTDTYDPKNNEIRNTHINIGTGTDISIKDLAFLIKDEIGFRGTFYFNKEKPDGTMVKRTDVTKIRNLGWRHTLEIREGIKALYNYYSKPLTENLID
jgi:GDP-L-fucose synthase